MVNKVEYKEIDF